VVFLLYNFGEALFDYVYVCPLKCVTHASEKSKNIGEQLRYNSINGWLGYVQDTYRYLKDVVRPSVMRAGTIPRSNKKTAGCIPKGSPTLSSTRVILNLVIRKY
jgi:hypothetical protein